MKTLPKASTVSTDLDRALGLDLSSYFIIRGNACWVLGEEEEYISKPSARIYISRHRTYECEDQWQYLTLLIKTNGNIIQAICKSNTCGIRGLLSKKLRTGKRSKHPFFPAIGNWVSGNPYLVYRALLYCKYFNCSFFLFPRQSVPASSYCYWKFLWRGREASPLVDYKLTSWALSVHVILQELLPYIADGASKE